jgi:hypothetical protein
MNKKYINLKVEYNLERRLSGLSVVPFCITRFRMLN